ncbi:MAG: Uma2 family endonuclease [Chloroflexota bacterium]|nr:Uma2 family endonuclease [Chloroflexota bacterium]MDE2853434.1 Uma2 family endonuclease [Chloroflexota bacterium]MDE2947711.1 Uma2 family endonuclease [Chloroflexota bacterium]
MVIEQQLQQISADGFLKIAGRPEYADRILELVNGEIIEMPLPNGEHGEILAILTVRIGHYVLQNELGRVTTGDAGFVLERNPDGRDTVRGLDLAFVSKSKAPAPLPNTLIEFAPDLAVEVISPSNDAADIRLKIRQLLDAGTSLVWTVYPDLRIVDAHTRDGANTLNEADMLCGGDVLPGFEIPVREIFPTPASN